MEKNFSAKPQGSLRELLKTLIAIILNRLHLAGIEYKEYFATIPACTSQDYFWII